MKIKHVLLIIAIIELLLFTVFCPNKGDTTGYSFFKIDRSIDFSKRIETVHAPEYKELGWLGSRQLPTIMFKNTSNLHTYQQSFANSQAIDLKIEPNYAVSSVLNSKNEQMEVYFSDLNYNMNNKNYSSSNSHKNSPVLNILSNKLALLFPSKSENVTPVILDDSKSKSQYGFLAISTNVNIESTGMGEESIENRRFGNIDPDGDPEGPPIPIPDGFWVLLLFAISYAGWIYVNKGRLKKLKL